jgi:hypothetical protein
MGVAIMDGDGRGGNGSGCGAGMVVPRKSVMNEIAGCADNVSVLPHAVIDVEGVEEVTGTTDAVGTDIGGVNSFAVLARIWMLLEVTRRSCDWTP